MLRYRSTPSTRRVSADALRGARRYTIVYYDAERESGREACTSSFAEAKNLAGTAVERGAVSKAIVLDDVDRPVLQHPRPVRH